MYFKKASTPASDQTVPYISWWKMKNKTWIGGRVTEQHHFSPQWISLQKVSCPGHETSIIDQWSLWGMLPVYYSFVCRVLCNASDPLTALCALHCLLKTFNHKNLQTKVNNVKENCCKNENKTSLWEKLCYSYFVAGSNGTFPVCTHIFNTRPNWARLVCIQIWNPKPTQNPELYKGGKIKGKTWKMTGGIGRRSSHP